MDKLQWIFVGGVSITITAFIFFLYFLFSYGVLKKKIKRDQTLQDETTFEKIKKRKQRSLKNIWILVILTLITGSCSGYIAYYQATNLSDADSVNLSEGYYYLSDLKEDLETIQSEEDTEKVQQSISFIATAMSSYSIKKASTFNTVDGQRVLNRYYSAMAELGINISRDSNVLTNNSKVLTETLQDVEKVQEYQKNVLDFFKVNVSALEAQK